MPTVTDYAQGYQEGLRDVARALVAEGLPGALTWLEDNLVACPVREDVVRLARARDGQ